MAYTEFLNYLSYRVGDVVVYNAGSYVFVTAHLPGVWNPLEVVQINQTTSYRTADFNTLPNYNLSSPLAPAKYHVSYYVNNDDLVMFDSFPVDTQVYLPGETAVIQGYDTTHFSQDGVWAYEFSGWSLIKGTLEEIVHTAGEQYIVSNHDLNLYAQWNKVPTITVDADGTLMLITTYKDAIQSLYIPEYFNGSRIKKIGTHAFLNSSIEDIVVPPNIVEIFANAFEGWTGSAIRFIDSEVTDKYPLLKLYVDCFYDTRNLVSITLPYRWRQATGIIFPEASNKSDVMNIYIRNTKAFMEEKLGVEDAEDYIADASNLSINYDRVFHWGYND